MNNEYDDEEAKITKSVLSITSGIRIMAVVSTPAPRDRYIVI